MTWTKLSDNFNDRADLEQVSRSARLLYVELLVYGNLTGRDGRIPRSKLTRATDLEDPGPELTELAEVGAVEFESDIIVVDWSDQATKEQIDKRRADTKHRKDRWNRHRSGDHSLCLPGSCKQAGTRSGTRDGTDDGTLPRPARPVPKGNGSGTDAGFAGAPPAPRREVQVHAYLDDGSGLSCERCHLPAENRAHASADERKTA